MAPDDEALVVAAAAADVCAEESIQPSKGEEEGVKIKKGWLLRPGLA